MAQEISSDNFATDVLKSEVPVLLDFTASWCGPCQQIAPLIDELSSEMDGRAKVYKVDVDNNSELAQQYGVMSVPTLMLIKNGNVVNRWVGFTPKSTLAEAIEGAMVS